MQRQKKAFTLTELLVVVVIIGVLSAVVLPKYSKMLNTRRTTEAEDIMAAVRQEQEYRCASDRNYTTAKTDLSSLASLPDNLSSKNYTYTLGGSGITATAKTGSYNLQMPSYTDGRICCSGDGCSDLNKDYVACNSIPVSNSGCEVNDPGVAPQTSAECTDGEVRGSQSCSTCGGVQTTQKCVNGVWTAHLGECSIDQSNCSCELVSGAKPSNKTEVCNSCGTKTISYSCNTTNWTWQRNEGACSASAGQCSCTGIKPSETRDCSSCGGTQTQTVTCDGYTGNWQELGDWSGCSVPEEDCGDPCECSFGESASVLKSRFDGNNRPLTQDTCDNDYNARFSCDDVEVFGEYQCTDVYYDPNASSLGGGGNGGSGGSGGSRSCTGTVRCGTEPGSSIVITCPCDYHCERNSLGQWLCKKGQTPLNPVLASDGMYYVYEVKCCPNMWEDSNGMTNDCE